MWDSTIYDILVHCLIRTMQEKKTSWESARNSLGNTGKHSRKPNGPRREKSDQLHPIHSRTPLLKNMWALGVDFPCFESRVRLCWLTLYSLPAFSPTQCVLIFSSRTLHSVFITHFGCSAKSSCNILRISNQPKLPILLSSWRKKDKTEK